MQPPFKSDCRYHNGGGLALKPKGESGFLGDILESLIIAIVLAVVIRAFIFQPFYIPSGSMMPTLYRGDRIIVSKLSYRFHPPQRGDIVVFHYPRNPKKTYIKRLIGLGGETVALADGKLFINGQEVPEPYLPPGTYFADFGPVKVPEGCYFMLGDNRMNSEDSRVWGFLNRRLIIGKAVLVYWPPDHIKVIH
ncbi:signal peptidase I [Thermodesulfitimonas autotrophica]|uniref:signal peptidase I n=1 Tax=Thermodesulfitimonas autotrophica TaxID=1894989 RepID=UPI002FDFF35B